jgi:hypothetical protein
MALDQSDRKLSFGPQWMARCSLFPANAHASELERRCQPISRLQIIERIQIDVGKRCVPLGEDGSPRQPHYLIVYTCSTIHNSRTRQDLSCRAAVNNPDPLPTIVL